MAWERELSVGRAWSHCFAFSHKGRKTSLANVCWWNEWHSKSTHLFWSKQGNILLKISSKWFSGSYFGNWVKLEFQTLHTKIWQRLDVGEKRIPHKLPVIFSPELGSYCPNLFFRQIELNFSPCWIHLQEPAFWEL